MGEFFQQSEEVIDDDTDEAQKLTDRDFLKLSGWSPIGTLASVREPQQDYVSKINSLPPDARTVALAQYTLYLGDASIRPLEDASREMGKISTPPGSHSPTDQKIIEDFLLASALNSELVRLQFFIKVYPDLAASIKGYTADFTSKDTACLNALERIADIPDNFKAGRLPRENIAATKSLLRAIIADWVHEGLFTPRSDDQEE